MKQLELELWSQAPPKPPPQEYSLTAIEEGKGCVSEYVPGGNAGKTQKYYRFSYRSKGKIHHKHIKGGNTTSPLAQYRVICIRGWIAQDKPLEVILDWISRMTPEDKGRKT